ncbi:MAG: ribokinase [Phototrophicaceae bacterium]
MARIIVLGSINMDVVVTAERHPQIGETIFGKDVHFIAGGKGANQAIAAKRLGGDVMLIGRLGDDAFGQSLQQVLHSEHIDITHVQHLPDHPTGTALITVNAESDNTIVVVSGANKAIQSADIDAIQIESDDIVVSQFEMPQDVIFAVFKKARAVGAKTLLNVAPAEAMIAGLAELTTHIIVNETELAFLTTKTLSEDSDTLLEMMHLLAVNAQQTIIVTLGKAGVLSLVGDASTKIDGRIVNAVDTTGAGDCFVGALAVALSENQSLHNALQFANQAASLSVQKLGASSSMPYRSDLNNM